MKRIKSYLKEYRWFITTLLAIPIVIQILLNYGFFANIAGGSNDGWLGFWGGYLGSIISVTGVFSTFRSQRNDDIEREKRSKRPVINLAYQNGLKIGDKVFHSTSALLSDNENARFINVYNPSDNVSMSMLVAIYNEKEEIIDIVNIQHLRNEHATVYFRNNDKLKIKKVLVSFLTERNEYGLAFENYTNDENFTDIEINYGKFAEIKRNEIISAFNDHNKQYSSLSTNKWYRNETFMDENLKSMWQEQRKILDDYNKDNH